jgi:hypothetical protein
MKKNEQTVQTAQQPKEKPSKEQSGDNADISQKQVEVLD